jgi:phosphatidylglycerophosphate synthase
MNYAKSERIRAVDIAYVIVSYGMTAVRLGIAAFSAYSLVNDVGYGRFLSAFLVAAIMILDYLDGVMFGRSILSELKNWRISRRVFDSVADRLVIQTVCLPLLIIDPTFLVFYVAILGREMILSVQLARFFSRGVLVYPSTVARVAMVFIGLTAIVFLLDMHNAVVFGSTVAMLYYGYLALQNYKKRFISCLTGLPKNNRTEIIEIYSNE